MTKIVTFYSYKGGVGRTMALVNTAYVLARDGWRVLMVDFDLEAPGMTHFFAKLVRDRPKGVQRDGLDLLLHAKRTLAVAERDEQQPQVPGSLSEYVINVELPQEWLERRDSGIPYRNGRLDFLPATLEPIEEEERPGSEPAHDYLRRMDELDLPGIFATDGPGHRFGDLVRQYFVHARFQAPGDALLTMRDKVQAAYDVVLIDSRTGLNEISGLCIGPTCDALVICSGLNRQNIYGTRYFMDKAGLLDREKAKPFAVVAGPVPAWHTRESEAQITLMRKALGAETIVEVPYHPAAALAETVFIQQEPKDPISKSYEELAPVLQSIVIRERSGEFTQRSLRPLREVAHGKEKERAWLNLSREIAGELSQCRLERQVPAHLSGIFASFPTACTVAALSRRRTKQLGWADVEPLTLAAAVSAYTAKSDRPFLRCWELASNAQDEDVRNDLAVRLLFLQLRVLGTLPKADLWRKPLEWGLSTLRKVQRADLMSEAKTTILLDVCFAAVFLKSYSGAVCGALPEELLSQAPAKIMSRLVEIGERHPRLCALLWRPAFYRPRRRGEELWRLYPPLALSLAKPTLEVADKLLIRKFIKGAGLPLPAEELAGWPLPGPGRLYFEQAFRLEFPYGELFEREFFGKERGELPEPLGFWPALMVASALSLLKGQEATKEILAWLGLARTVYGYAWRVLADWRHLEAVRTHPAFVDLLRAEDGHAKAIEAAIDSGEYPL